MLNTVEFIEKEKLADKIFIYKRGADIIYQNEFHNGEWIHEPLARVSVENERNRLWTLPERMAYAKNFDRLVELIKNPLREATKTEINTILSLQKEAYNQIKNHKKSANISSVYELSTETQELINIYLEQYAIFKEAVQQKVENIGENNDLYRESAKLSRQSRQSMLSIAGELNQKEDFQSLYESLTRGNAEDIFDGKNVPLEEIKEKFSAQILSPQETVSLCKNIIKSSVEFIQAKNQSLSLEEDRGHSY